MRFLTAWFAQAEHGGFYQATATGMHAKRGLDVTIQMGGPQINAMQLLTGGDCDMAMGYVIQVAALIAAGTFLTLAASDDQQTLALHEPVQSMVTFYRLLVPSGSAIVGLLAVG